MRMSPVHTLIYPDDAWSFTTDDGTEWITDTATIVRADLLPRDGYPRLAPQNRQAAIARLTEASQGFRYTAEWQPTAVPVRGTWTRPWVFHNAVILTNLAAADQWHKPWLNDDGTAILLAASVVLLAKHPVLVITHHTKGVLGILAPHQPPGIGEGPA